MLLLVAGKVEPILLEKNRERKNGWRNIILTEKLIFKIYINSKSRNNFFSLVGDMFSRTKIGRGGGG